ncbi:hypothetical protein Droror1_Dr00024073, partial [Drosera rotundifolia]
MIPFGTRYHVGIGRLKSIVASSVARGNPATRAYTVDPELALARANDLGLVFRGKKNEERYREVKRRMIVAIVYYNSPALSTLGLLDDEDNLLERLQMKTFPHNSWPTYYKL